MGETVTNHQNPQSSAQTKDDKAILLLGVIRVRVFDGVLIRKDRRGFCKSYSMFSFVGGGFSRIPNELQIVHDYIIITLYLFFNGHANGPGDLRIHPDNKGGGGGDQGNGPS